ncbi:imidazolonepropionase [Algoriphagus halophytocola]|uniref:Imidazolonepropionase n=1 Tax=Algoriphagus halophytocola TaxID=2991499 RepID=A0ABY6MKN1_9BACT|nr:MULTISPECIES: imidazolonepropionase [unclassified Algoriphagus]UZD24079.1 imidazolonepropionase [Algoriphagus sp. TR-M5]WBL41450.1 imidazolonepropionase [Algoriphagus sp. TR-M9]
MKKLIGPISQLLTLDKLPLKGALKDEQLEILENAGILIEDEKILEVGTFSDLMKKANSLNAEIIELKGDFVALPGWIDCHTHICFGGTRAQDFAMRNAGKSYLEIAEAGGGIWDTVTQTRKLTQSELADRTISNANRHLSEGVTTIEVKSGYGLNVAEELKMLRAIKQACQETKADLIPTCLAAHVKPRDFEGTNQEYLEMISEELFPILKSENLADRIDSFVEKSAFSPEEIDSYYQKAKDLGFDLTVHADQFTKGGSTVAVKFKAKSADHLEASTEKEIALLANSKTVAVALPGASIGLGCAFTPARKILDQGGSLAIGSDWNPGSAPMGDLLTQASILATFEKLSSAEVLSALTSRAAWALGLEDRGVLKTGLLADFNLFPTSDYREILYHQGKLKPAQVWKKGVKI